MNEWINFIIISFLHSIVSLGFGYKPNKCWVKQKNPSLYEKTNSKDIFGSEIHSFKYSLSTEEQKKKFPQKSYPFLMVELNYSKISILDKHLVLTENVYSNDIQIL